MHVVRLDSTDIVAEVIPDYALPVEDWFGEAFAANCMVAPNEVVEGYFFNRATGQFMTPDHAPVKITVEVLHEQVQEEIGRNDFQDGKIKENEQILLEFSSILYN